MNFNKQLDNFITFIVACYASCFMNFCSIVFFRVDSYSLGVIITGLAITVFFLRNMPVFAIGMRSSFFNLSLVLFVLYPLFAFVYSPYKDPMEICKHIFYSMLMLYTILLIIKGDNEQVGKLYLWALIITAIGGLLSVYAPQYFNEFAINRISRHSGKTLESYEYTMSWGRAYGFQFQPNAFAISLMSFMFGFIYFFQTKSAITKIMTIFFCGFVIILSGSRSGLMIYMVICGLFLCHSYFRGIYLKNGRMENGSRTIVIFLISGILALTAFFVLKPILFPNEQIYTFRGAQTPLTRMINFFSGDISQDMSVTSRLSIQLEYLKYVLTCGLPALIGSGYASIDYFVISGKFELIPHNIFVHMLVEYGVFFMVLFIFLFTSGTLSVKRIQNIQEKFYAFDFIAVLFVSGMCGELFKTPELPLAIGIYIGIISKSNLIRR